MRVGIVEGEPGIFPDPIARFLRRIFRRNDERELPPREPDPSDDEKRA
jgi:hypothetical protein